MKRLLIVAMLALLATPASAQTVFRPLTGYKILFSGTMAATSPFGSGVRFARVVCTVTCHVAFSVTPVVVATSLPIFLPPMIKEYFRVSPGNVVLVIRDQFNGTLYVTEME